MIYKRTDLLQSNLTVLLVRKDLTSQENIFSLDACTDSEEEKCNELLYQNKYIPVKADNHVEVMLLGINAHFLIFL